jgi:hypothetical protein
LTIERMAPTLAELDLSHAIVLMRGPTSAVDPAFAAIGRAPTYIHASKKDDSAPIAPPTPTEPTPDEDPTHVEIARALTDQSAAGSLAFTIAPGYAAGSIGSCNANGPMVAGALGYHFDPRDVVGVHVSFASLSGTCVPTSLTSSAFELAGYLQGIVLDRLWGAFTLGLHADATTMGTQSWNVGVGTGLVVGVDVYKRRRHRIGVMGSAMSVLGTSSGYTMFSVGVAYRQ